MTQSWKSDCSPAQLWKLLKDTFTAWSNDKVPRHGAALAYYTVLSLVPLLVVIIAMIGFIFGREVGQGYILEQIGSLVGPQSAEAIKEMIQRASEPSTGIVATVFATGTLLLGASGVFAQLQDSLNSIWGVKPKEGRGLWGLIRDRFLSFAAILGTGFLLLVSLVLSAALSAFGKWFGGWLPAPELDLTSVGIRSFARSDHRIICHDLQGASRCAGGVESCMDRRALTALLFTVGKFAIGLYLGKSDVGSAYGAAGSLVIVLVWVYYSAQILLFGAEFTQVYANSVGTRIVPSENAVVEDPHKAKDAGGVSPVSLGRDIDRHTDSGSRAGFGAALSAGRPSASDKPFPWWVGLLVIGMSVIRVSLRLAK